VFIKTLIAELGRTIRYAIGTWGRTVRLIVIATTFCLLVTAFGCDPTHQEGKSTSPNRPTRLWTR
jgi:hypothetical protein